MESELKLRSVCPDKFKSNQTHKLRIYFKTMHSNFGDNTLSNYTNREIIGPFDVIQAREPTDTSTDVLIAKVNKSSP